MEPVEHTAENDAPRYHSRDCMDAYPGPCICGVNGPRHSAENDARTRVNPYRVIPPEVTGP